jgi:hypothetical protein
MRRRTRFDIDIPLNELTITVIDTFTHEPLPGATVRIDILSLSVPKRPVMSRTVTTGDAEDGAGRVVLTSIPERDIVLQVSLAGYEKQRLKPFSLTKSEKKEIEVQLVPLRGISGKIVSQRPFDSAVVVWFSPSGSETERADVAADGTFIYAGSHEPTETMAVVSLSHPLWVLRSPPVARRETMTIRFPDTAPTREFDVWTTDSNPRYSRHIGLVIGGVRVPQPVLRQHLTLRRMPTTLRGGGQLHFRDILETGPIDVLLGPMTEEVSSRAGGMDLFALPQFSEVPRLRLRAGEAAVAFTVK